MSGEDEGDEPERLFTRSGIVTTAGNRELERRARRLLDDVDDEETPNPETDRG